MQFTLEEHFKCLSEMYEQVKEVYCLWTLLKRDISEKLSSVYRIFPYFSRHDASHSRTIITNIELFLGEERIRKLSATDTFMLLICAYTHDYGMALELEEILEILSDEKGEFKSYLRKHTDNNNAAKRLMQYYNKGYSDGNLRELYYSIVLILQEYNRPEHWKGVEKIKVDYDNIFLGRIKARFVKSIIRICEMHGKDIEEIETLSRNSNGMFADVFHPRFIAAMIRLGDLLDLDNNRFSKEFVMALRKEYNSIPDLSNLHYLKHESITHFFISPMHIDIEASCEGDNALSVARELYEWLHWLENDCSYLKSEWDVIAQRNFGAAPRIRKKRILVNDLEYHHFVYNLKMELPSDKIFDLLAGSNVYDNKYVAFREIIQNAMDATLLQAWKDFYNSVTPKKLNNECSKEFAKWCLSDKFKNDYRIQVNVIDDKRDDAVYVEVIDNGIGIDDEDLQYMCRIGENNICNPKRHQLISQMPDWFVPSGVFGIGLQSAFQLTDEIEFFTKKANRTPRHIRFSSYSSNKGKIEVSKCPDTYGEQFRKLSTQGTLVRLKINIKMFKNNDDFDYFDLNFDQSEINNHVVQVEIIHQLKQYFKINAVNYFPIWFSNYKIIDNSISNERENIKFTQKTFYDKKFYETLLSDFFYAFSEKQKIKMYYWDEKKKIFFTIDIPKCKLLDRDTNCVSLECFDDSFSIKYKYNIISDYRQMFGNDYYNSYAKVIELNNNIIKLSVNVLDKNSENYLNIDRNVLKYNSIKYFDIVECEENMFTKLCDIMIGYNFPEGKPMENELRKIYHLQSKCESLSFFPKLSVLFARFAEETVFSKFKDKYKSKLENISIQFNDDSNPVELNLSFFLGSEKSFYVYDDIEIGNFSDVEEFKENAIYIERLYEHFPKNFFVPISVKIQNYGQTNHIIYQCKIRHELCREPTEVDDDCWKLDCIRLMNYDANQLVKKAFKPISKYKNLCVYKFPKTFQKSFVFKNVLDNNIVSYILSPFDMESAKKLFECKNCKSSELQAHIREIQDFLEENIHFNKCIDYIKKNQSSEITKQKIKGDYFKLIEEMAKIFNINCSSNDDNINII